VARRDSGTEKAARGVHALEGHRREAARAEVSGDVTCKDGLRSSRRT